MQRDISGKTTRLLSACHKCVLKWLWAAFVLFSSRVANGYVPGFAGYLFARLLRINVCTISFRPYRFTKKKKKKRAKQNKTKIYNYHFPTETFNGVLSLVRGGLSDITDFLTLFRRVPSLIFRQSKLLWRIGCYPVRGFASERFYAYDFIWLVSFWSTEFWRRLVNDNFLASFRRVPSLKLFRTKWKIRKDQRSSMGTSET